MIRIRALNVSVLALFATLAGPPSSVGAQARETEPTAEGWNSPRVIELVELGRLARQQLVQDGRLQTYRARVDGNIYFFLDPDVGERILMRLDQIAVELRWAAPDRFQQRIVGERSETRLPVEDFRFYLDRLTLVEHGFADEIRIGSGLDVARVPHPLAALSDGSPASSPYDFRLTDSLSIAMPGRPEPIRVYEMDVRPRDPARPGIIGTFALEGATASIVRMAFSFTPASYVDPRTDRISVSLDYGLWEDRYWLPNQQRLEVRRELPEIDFGVGTVIRSVLRTGDYELNVPLPDDFANLPAVTAVAPADRRSFPFPEGLYDALERDGLAEIVVDPNLRALRAEAQELAARRAPSGLSPIRLHVPNLSSAVRFTRAEGFFLGAGLSAHPDPRISGELLAGYAFGARKPQGSVKIRGRLDDRWSLEAEGRFRSLVELGLAPGSDALLSSLGGALRGEDYRDPYLATGAALTLIHETETAMTVSVTVGMERARTPEQTRETAPLDGSRILRPIRPIAEGDFLGVALFIRRGVEWPGRGRGRTELGANLLNGREGNGVGLRGEAEGRWGPPSGTRELQAIARGWTWEGDPLPQGHRLLGGRGTIPGFPFHAAMGQTAVQGSLVASSDLGGPFARLRAGLHAGWTNGGPDDLEEIWDAHATEGTLMSASLGVGLAWDLLRIEVARGFSGGEWQLLLTLDPRWWDRL